MSSAIHAARAGLLCRLLGIGASVLVSFPLVPPNAHAGGALRPRPWTPWHAALEQVADLRGVTIEQVMADPEAYLPQPRTRDVGPADRALQAQIAVYAPPPLIHFGFPQLLHGDAGMTVAGDFDGDLRTDLAIVSATTGEIEVFEGAAIDPLQTTRTILLEAGDELRAAADMDGDGRADLIASGDGPSVAIYRSLGASRFAPPARHAVEGVIVNMIAGDVTGDGRPDLVVISDGSPTAIITLLNSGNGDLTAGALVSGLIPYGWSNSAVLGDLDGDGRRDLALLTPTGGSANGPARITVVRNVSDATWTAWAQLDLPHGSPVSALAGHDLDGDHLDDLVAFDMDTLLIWRSNGDGTFTNIVSPAIDDAYSSPAFAVVADFDADGRDDLALALRAGHCFTRCPRVLVLPGDGAGGLLNATIFMADDPNRMVEDPSALVSGDFDGDGFMDLVAGFRGSSNRRTLLQNDRVGGFDNPVSVDLQVIPRGLDAVHVRPGGAPDLLVWDGVSTWLTEDMGGYGFQQMALFADGEVVTVADLTGDGHDDVMLARGDTSEVYVNDGGGFALHASYTGGVALVCAEFDGANGLDLAVADSTGRVFVRANDGAGQFGAPVDRSATLTSDVTSVSGADLDLDGFAELLVGHHQRRWRDTRDSIAIHWNNGVAFAPPQYHEFGFSEYPTHPSTIAPGDFDGNGWPDLFVVAATMMDNPGSISILINEEDRSFLPSADYDCSPDPWEGVVADFDRDGLDDVAVVLDRDNWNGSVFVFRAGPGGVLTRMDESAYGGMTAEHYPTSLAVGDWNGDDRLDLVAGNRFSQSVTFFRNLSVPGGTPTPIAISLVSAEAGPGGVKLEWYATATAIAPTLERDAGDGWQARARLMADGMRRLAWTDTAVEPGRRYGYRLAWSEGGTVRRTAETWLDVPITGAPTLALAGARPNPAIRSPVLVFTLPDAADAVLDVFDVSGRRVANRRLAAPAPGHHSLAIGAERPLAPGLYLARLTQSGRTVAARFAVID